MAKDIYRQLQEQLDSYSVGFPATKSGVENEILKKLFSEEDAGIFLSLSPTLEKPEDIAARLDLPTDQLAEKLENMAARGLLFRLKKNNQVKYGATAFIHGIFEFQLPHLDLEFVKLIRRYFNEGLGKSLIDAKGNFLRTIPIAGSIPPEYHIASFDDAATILRSAGKIVVADCICRKSRDISGNSCGAPLEVCLMFGSMGQYYIDNNMGREVSVEEAIAIVGRAQEAGLVTQPATSQNPTGMCNCCSDCCGVLAAIKKDPCPADLVYSNNYAEVEADYCSGCGECLPVCHMEAIQIVDDGSAAILEKRCIGCGVCVTRCPSEAIRLKEKPEEKRRELPKNSFEQMLQIMEARSQS
jgi:Na+-translocating ferredoxin:NAD+ oxidoreductase subunit B